MPWRRWQELLNLGGGGAVGRRRRYSKEPLDGEMTTVLLGGKFTVRVQNVTYQLQVIAVELLQEPDTLLSAEGGRQLQNGR